jgi:F0F1-type ATP synthase assembly protein I
MTVTAAERMHRRRIVLSGYLDREGISPMVGFPLLLIPLAVYNIIAFLMPSVSFADVLFKVPMITGEAWPVTLADVMLALGIVLLLLEVVKGARPGSKFLMDHLLSLIVFGAAAAEFVMWPKFGNSTYFLLVLLAMADFLGGIAQRTRRRVAYVAETTVPAPRKTKRQAETPADEFEPKFEPVSAPRPAPAEPPAPTAQSVAESVLMDHPAPKPVQSPPSPEIPSPHLQPGNGTQPSPDAPR